MSIPKNPSHTPIVVVDNYEKHDGPNNNASNTDVRSLSIGKATYNANEISAKVFRQPSGKWSRQSEELPLHRVIDLSTLILLSILKSNGVSAPLTELQVKVKQEDEKLDIIKKFYKDNKAYLLPKLQELQVVLDYFMQEEQKF